VSEDYQIEPGGECLLVADCGLSRRVACDPKQPLMSVYCRHMLLAFMEDSD